MAKTKTAIYRNWVYEIPADMSVEDAVKAKVAKRLERDKETIPPSLFVRLWETAEDFDGFIGLVKNHAQEYYFTPASAKQRASKYRKNNVPLKKYPVKSRGIEALDYAGLADLVKQVRANKK